MLAAWNTVPEKNGRKQQSIFVVSLELVVFMGRYLTVKCLKHSRIAALLFIAFHVSERFNHVRFISKAVGVVALANVLPLDAYRDAIVRRQTG